MVTPSTSRCRERRSPPPPCPARRPPSWSAPSGPRASSSAPTASRSYGKKAGAMASASPFQPCCRLNREGLLPLGFRSALAAMGAHRLDQREIAGGAGDPLALGAIAEPDDL